MNTEYKGNVSVSSDNNAADPRDIEISKETMDELKAAGSIRYENGQVTVGRDRTTVSSSSIDDSQVGVMSTLRSPTGRKITDQTAINPKKDLISYGGTDMTVDTAVRIGVLGRTGDGNYYSISEGRPGSPQEQQFRKDAKAAESAHEVQEISLKGGSTDAVRSLKDHAPNIDNHFSRIFNGLANGNEAQASNAVADMAQAAGATVESCINVANELVENLVDSVAEFAKLDMNIDLGEDFVDDVFDKFTPRRIHQILLMAYHNDLNGLRGQIRSYVNGNRDPK